MGRHRGRSALDATDLTPTEHGHRSADDDAVVVRVGGRDYRWLEYPLPFTGSGGDWWHPGLAIRGDGTLLAFDQGTSSLIEIRADGSTGRIVPLPSLVGHGLTVDADGARTWIADPGIRARVVDGAVLRDDAPGSVMCLDEAGTVTLRLETPPLAVYRHKPFRPTSVCVLPGHEADAETWVADGYGQSLVHRFAADGRYLGSIDGPGTSAHFDCPHALFVDDRGPEPFVLIADRGNAVIRAYDRLGSYRGDIGAGELTSPSGMAVVGDVLVVAELRGRLAAFDGDGRSMPSLGASGRDWRSPGWPNALRVESTVRPTGLVAGTFNSPHAIVADTHGRILVAEWLVGGRLIVLEPVSG